MTGIDGISVANQILTKSPLSKVIIYTGIPEVVIERKSKFIIEKKGNIESLNNVVLLISSQSYSFHKLT